MKLTKEQQKLVLDNHNLIYKCLKKYNLSNEEYYDVAAYALCKAALHFDPDKGYKFSTYACMAILNEFKLQFRKNSLPEGYSLVSLNSTIEDPSDGRTKELEDIVGDEFNYEDWAISKAELIKNIYLLNSKEIKVFNLIMDDLTQVEIARELGTSRAYISKVAINIRDKLSGNKKGTKNSGKDWDALVEKINDTLDIK